MTLSAPHVRTRQIRENSRIAGIGRGLNAHWRVAKVAVELAQAYYEVHMAANNHVYRAFRQNLTEKQSRIAFLARIAPTLLEEARLALTDLLSQPDNVISQSDKDEVAEALMLDNDLRANRVKAAEHMPTGLLH